MDHRWQGDADAAITISFDDGYAATWDNAVFTLHQRGLYSTFNIITSLVGTTFSGIPTANWDQWHKAANLGHEIGSHGHDHTALAGKRSDLRRLFSGLQATPSRQAYLRQVWATRQALKHWKRPSLAAPAHRRPTQMIEDLHTSREQIDQALGRTCTTSFAYPNGRYNATACQLVAKAGFTSARSLDLGLNTYACSSFALRAVSLGPGISIQDLISWIDAACARHAWLILVFHLIAEQNDTGYPYFCSTVDFQRLLDAIQSRPVWTATQRQVLQHLTESEGYEPGTSL